ncbi:hypothetical protein ACFP47_03345 [Nesterenkonia lacusekhoensis]|uniref:Peptidoglycan binding domain-containing protein n=1 Tax=Nesterenkonia lacusekhoensis TaxID=150832 RepID=A0ABS4T3Q4_9MICC|nr:hypothetical protein [Nesterenkonia lacusekhoensis]MBP2318594.1 hypothetical protein [Nesterenkonia lacusekhoensis]
MAARRDDRRVVVTRETARRRRRRRALVALGVGAAVVAGTGYGAWRFIDENEYLLEEGCSVSLGGDTFTLTPEQTRTAADLSAAAADRGLDPEAAVDAVAISLQESDLTARDLPAEDQAAADESTEASAEQDEPADPAPEYFARSGPQWSSDGASHGAPTTAEDFFSALEETEGWSPELDLEESAEVLDRPHNASFYPQHEDLARAFTTPLTGQQPMDLSCELAQRDVPDADPQGYAEALISSFPTLLEEQAVEVAEDGVVITVPDRDAAEEGQSQQDLDWLFAHWSLAMARDYGLQNIDVGAHTWDRDAAAWQQGSTAEDGTVRLGFDRDED